MSLFQCENCGCVENTAVSNQGFIHSLDSFSWEGIEHLRGKKLCSACGPSKYHNGKLSGFGVWHNVFKRTFLPIGMFKTNSVGNIQHIETCSENYKEFICEAPEHVRL